MTDDRRVAYLLFRRNLHWAIRHPGQRRWEVFKAGVSVGRFRSVSDAFDLAVDVGDRVTDHKYHFPASACWKFW